MRLRDTKILITAHGDASTVTIFPKKILKGGQNQQWPPSYIYSGADFTSDISEDSLSAVLYFTDKKSIWEHDDDRRHQKQQDKENFFVGMKLGNADDINEQSKNKWNTSD